MTSPTPRTIGNGVIVERKEAKALGGLQTNGDSQCADPQAVQPKRSVSIVERFLKPSDLVFFVRESNRIEGIHRAPLMRELKAHTDLLMLDRITVADMENFVGAVAPGKPLRAESGMNVRVADHLPLPGGPNVVAALANILDYVEAGGNPWYVHVSYETLHPFMDGNGRSGRALWLWQMLHQRCALYALQMGFLHLFYYQTLQQTGRDVISTPLRDLPVERESSRDEQET